MPNNVEYPPNTNPCHYQIFIGAALCDYLDHPAKTTIAEQVTCPACLAKLGRTKGEQVTRIRHEMENAVYYGFNLGLALMDEPQEVLDALEAVLARVEAARPGKDRNRHINAPKEGDHGNQR